MKNSLPNFLTSKRASHLDVMAVGTASFALAAYGGWAWLVILFVGACLNVLLKNLYGNNDNKIFFSKDGAGNPMLTYQEGISPNDMEAVNAFVNESLTSYKRRVGIVIVDELVRNPNDGTVPKWHLAKALEEKCGVIIPEAETVNVKQ